MGLHAPFYVPDGTLPCQCAHFLCSGWNFAMPVCAFFMFRMALCHASVRIFYVPGSILPCLHAHFYVPDGILPCQCAHFYVPDGFLPCQCAPFYVPDGILPCQCVRFYVPDSTRAETFNEFGLIYTRIR